MYSVPVQLNGTKLLALSDTEKMHFGKSCHVLVISSAGILKGYSVDTQNASFLFSPLHPYGLQHI